MNSDETEILIEHDEKYEKGYNFEQDYSKMINYYEKSSILDII